MTCGNDLELRNRCDTCVGRGHFEKCLAIRCPVHDTWGSKLAEAIKRAEDAEHEADALSSAIDAADMDVSPCRKCGRPVVCIPDGLPFCKVCVGENN